MTAELLVTVLCILIRDLTLVLIHFLYVLCHLGVELFVATVLAPNLQTFKTSIRNIDFS